MDAKCEKNKLYNSIHKTLMIIKNLLTGKHVQPLEECEINILKSVGFLCANDKHTEKDQVISESFNLMTFALCLPHQCKLKSCTKLLILPKQ